MNRTEISFLHGYITKEFNLVTKELNEWKYFSQTYSEEVLAYQAVSSIKHKKFHCQGGSVYALYPGAKSNITSFIVAYQTISDYLDNLCDRTRNINEKAFRQLHLAIEDALKPDDLFNDYYKYYDYKNDGGYLKNLVLECKKLIQILPSYNKISQYIIELGRMYSDLQTYKHLDFDIRTSKLNMWSSDLMQPIIKERNANIYPCEFWAATGSTLGIFILVAMATDKDLEFSEVENVFNAYFPWISAVHIMLDYFIDMEEDKENSDLNFLDYYENKNEFKARMNYLIDKSIDEISKLKFREFHEMILKGLMAMYLSDPKIKYKDDKKIRKSFINATGTRDTKLMYRICRTLRSLNVI